jgi:uncharacterized membrane protein YraQ (UPF0718 family)
MVSKSREKWYILSMEKETKPRKETTMKENMGKLLLDLGKLVVGGIIIGGILRGAIPQVMLIISESVVAIILFVFGLLWTAKEKNEKKE